MLVRKWIVCLLVTLGYAITVLLFYMVFLSFAEKQSDLKKGLSVI